MIIHFNREEQQDSAYQSLGGSVWCSELTLMPDSSQSTQHLVPFYQSIETCLTEPYLMLLRLTGQSLTWKLNRFAKSFTEHRPSPNPWHSTIKPRGLKKKINNNSSIYSKWKAKRKVCSWLRDQSIMRWQHPAHVSAGSYYYVIIAFPCKPLAHWTFQISENLTEECLGKTRLWRQ